MQKLRIPVIQLKGCEPSTFYSSQSRLKNSRFNGESYRQFKTKTNLYTRGHGKYDSAALPYFFDHMSSCQESFSISSKENSLTFWFTL